MSLKGSTMGSSHFLWVAFWLVPRTTFAINQEQVIIGKLDPKWSQYISDIAGDYSENLPPATSPKPRHEPSERKGWSKASVGEAPYVAVIYPQQAQNNPAILDFSTAGSSCGAALITSDKIITLCACVASWWMFYFDNVWDVTGANYKFSDYNIKSKYLSVAHTKPTFVPDSHTSTLVGDKSVIDRQQKCTNYIQGNGNPLEQQVIVVIISMKDAIKYPFPGQYIPWPPAPILHDGPRNSPADVISFGFRSTKDPPRHYYSDYGEEIMLNTTALNCGVKKVNVEDCAHEFGQLRQEIQERSTCFQPSLSPAHEICGGLVGSPVVVGGNIQGMLATPINCGLDKGTTLVLDFVKPVKELIENFTGSALLNRQNTLRPKLWREDDVPHGFVAYEDGIFRQGPVPRSLSVRSAPSHAFIIALVSATRFPLPNFSFFSSILL